MNAKKNITVKGNEFINAISRLDDIRRKREEVLPIWESCKLRNELTDKERKTISEYEDMLDYEAANIKVGDKVVYRLDGVDEIYTGTVIDILDRGDISTDTDGVCCAGEYVKIASTFAGTPQISTGTADITNVSAKDENTEKAA